MNSRSLIIYAPTINIGGGLVLLEQLLRNSDRFQIIAIIDKRAKNKFNAKDIASIFWADIGIFGRLKAEYALKRLYREGSKILCLSNLPPLFVAGHNVYLYLQNFYFVAPYSLLRIGLLKLCRLWLQRLILSLRKNNIKFIVQTPTMRKFLMATYGIESDIIPFFDFSQLHDTGECKVYDFIYPASGEVHKNHENLVNAFVQLSHYGRYPSLLLTVDKHSYHQLYDWIKQVSDSYRLSIHLKCCSQHSDMSSLYSKSKALIYPSYFESFGLPLLEANHLGLDILASELDYVRDVVKPAYTFDPHSSNSIAKAIIRYKGYRDVELMHSTQDSTSFLKNLFLD